MPSLVIWLLISQQFVFFLCLSSQSDDYGRPSAIIILKQHLDFSWLQWNTCRLRYYTSNAWRYTFKILSHLLTHDFPDSSYLCISHRWNTHRQAYAFTGKPNSHSSVWMESQHKRSAGVWLSMVSVVSDTWIQPRPNHTVWNNACVWLEGLLLVYLTSWFSQGRELSCTEATHAICLYGKQRDPQPFHLSL